MDENGRRRDGRTLEELSRQARERTEEQERRVESLYENAAARRGYSAYEGAALTSKQALKDLCQEYALFCGADPVMKELLDRMVKYAELDATGGDAYREEAAFIKSLPAVFDRLETRFQTEEAEIQAEIRRVFPGGAPEQMTPELLAEDHRLTARLTALENRQRIAASLSVYFDTLTMGAMRDDPAARGYEDPAVERRLSEARAAPYRTAVLPGENGGYVQYLNAAGQPLDVTIPAGEAPAIARAPANLTAREVSRPDAPLFPHEPRMNDVQQLLAGECYLYAALQDAARLYPQKLKDAVKDNGDGTATVRFFERSLNRDGSKTYTPFYVRVDKATAKLGAWERGAQECLWVNVIERGYAMSGIHLTQGQTTVRPVNTDELTSLYQSFSQPGIRLTENLYQEYPWLIERKRGENGFTYHLREWKPSVASIEGGDESAFLETLLGADFQAHEIGVPDLAGRSPEAENWERRLLLSGADVRDPAQALRFALSENIPDEELRAFLSAPEDEVCRKLYQTDAARAFVTEEEYVRVMRQALRAGTDILSESMQRSGGVFDLRCAETLSLELDDRVPRDSVYTPTILSTVTGAVDTNWVYVRPTVQQRVFDDVADKLRKGFPVSAGSRHRAGHEQMLVADGHAYSVIGAFQTTDDPPRFYFRMRNPWGNRHMMGALGGLMGVDRNGVLYQADGTAKWVKTEDGVFDLEVKDFLREFDKLNYNGSPALEQTPHLRTEGYDVITPAQRQDAAAHTVTDAAFTEYARAANDLHASLLGTDSVWSKDSPQYEALKRSAEAFRDRVALSRGQDISVLRGAADDLQQKAQAYLDHLPAHPSRRQTLRENVCRTVMAVTLAVQAGSREPAKEIEAQYARRLMEANFRARKKPVPDDLDALAEKLTESRVFRSAVGKMSLNRMLNAGEAELQSGLRALETASKGRGIDPGLDPDTLRTKDYAVRL